MPLTVKLNWQAVGGSIWMPSFKRKRKRSTKAIVATLDNFVKKILDQVEEHLAEEERACSQLSDSSSK